MYKRSLCFLSSGVVVCMCSNIVKRRLIVFFALSSCMYLQGGREIIVFSLEF